MKAIKTGVGKLKHLNSDITQNADLEIVGFIEMICYVAKFLEVLITR